MTANLTFMPVSGNLIPLGTTGSHAFSLVILCGIAAGSVVVPLACDGAGMLFTGSPL